MTNLTKKKNRSGGNKLERLTSEEPLIEMRKTSLRLTKQKRLGPRCMQSTLPFVQRSE